MTTTEQKFRFGSIERGLDLSSTNFRFIIVEDVLEAFEIPKVNRFEVNGLTLPYMRDENYVTYQPKRIPCRPGCVIEVIYEPTRPDSAVVPSTTVSESSWSVKTLAESVEQLSIKNKENRDINIGLSELMSSTLTRRATTQLKSLKAVVAQANHSGRAFNPEGMKDLIGKHLVPANSTETTLQYLTQNMGLLVQDMGELKQQGNLLEQLARKMIDMQQQALDRLSLIQSKTEAILTQQLEIAEYPIPRLFIVLPEEAKQYDPANWFRTRFRLHFICECGKHTEPSESKVRHHLHLAKHEGYVIREPTKFFKKYGPFLLLMLEMIKFGTSVAGIMVPALACLKTIEISDSVKQTVDEVMGKIDYSLECIDKQFAKFDSSSPGDFADTDTPVAMTQQDLNNFLSNVEGLEGIELRQLGSFLKTSSKENLLGNLYRITTTEGHVKWVCFDHYRTGYHEKQVQKLREVVEQARGVFDEQQGKITISLASSIVADEFYQALSKARGVLELDLTLYWKCTTNDIQAVLKALKNSRVSNLYLDIRTFRSSFGSKLLSTTSQFDQIFQLRDLMHLKSVHIILSEDLKNIIGFQPTRMPTHSCNLSFSLEAFRHQIDMEWLGKAIKTDSFLTNLYFSGQSIANGAVQMVFEALKINSTLTRLSLGSNSIGENGAVALSEALKINTTLTTLSLGSNSIGDNEAVALSEALKINSTLTTLSLWRNSIKDNGAVALSEALKINTTLTTLDLWCNSIGENGAVALSEGLKINSTLTTLGLWGNSIRDNGAVALSESLKINSTLTTLDLGNNSIEEIGAQALSEALKINSTLTTLSLGNNLIGDIGALALLEALKINSSLTTLNLEYTMIGSELSLKLEKANAT